MKANNLPKKGTKSWWFQAWNVKTTFVVIPSIVWTRYEEQEENPVESMKSLSLMWGFWAVGIFTGKAK